MNRFALITLFRSLTRHKLYAALNIGGLAVGIAVFVVLGLYVRFETGFDRWLPGHDHLYLAEEKWDMPGSPADGISPYTMGGLVDQLREDFPATVAVRSQTVGANVIRGGVGTAEQFAYADPDFLDQLKLPMASGDGAGSLHDPASVLLNETMAAKYFPGEDAVGQSLTLNVNGKTEAYRVGGVFKDMPKASELDFTMLGRIAAKPDDPNWYHWGSQRVRTYLRFDTPAAAKAYAANLPAFVKRRGSKDLGDAVEALKLKLLPMADLHLQTPGRMLTVTTLGLVGLLTLLIAIVNYVNLATARAGLRAREVAMRKVLGANRRMLVRQFLGEAILTVALAAILGLTLTELSLPLINAAGGLSLTIPYPLVTGALGLLALVVGYIAGFYPAILLSRFPAAAVLASARSPGGGRAGARVREALVVFQFSLAIAFIIGTTVLVAQTWHVRTADLGFRRAGLLSVSSTADSALDPAQRTAFIDRVRQLPGVRTVVGSDSVPGYSTSNSNTVKVPGRSGDGPSIQYILVGPGFFETFGLKVLAGRLFDPNRGSDDSTGRNADDLVNVVINRNAAEALGFATPEAAIGKTVGGDMPRTIVGVVDNARFFSPRDPINSTLYYFYAHGQNDWATTLQVDGDPQAMIGAARNVWRQVAPQVPFSAKTVTQNLEPYYEADDRAARLFGIGAGLAVLIGCVGLWGLASFNTARRVKEVGIRKTLGASSRDIVRLLVGQFLRPVLIANIIAWPLAFVTMRAWLAGFDDRIALSPLYFIGASVAGIMIAVLTVIGQALRASRAAPAWALRHE